MRELARPIDKSPGYLSDVENGRVPPPSDGVIVDMAKALHIDKQELLSAARKISARASEVLAGYGALVGAPVPVEDITERYLGLSLRYGNLDRILGADVLGATYLEKRLVCINENLDNGQQEDLLFAKDYSWIPKKTHNDGQPSWPLTDRLLQVRRSRRRGAGKVVPFQNGTQMVPEPKK